MMDRSIWDMSPYMHKDRYLIVEAVMRHVLCDMLRV